MYEKILQCPEHGVSLARKRVMYGYPVMGGDYNDVILGGCCVSDDSPKFGYVCSVDQGVFYLIEGNLVKEDTDEDND